MRRCGLCLQPARSGGW